MNKELEPVDLMELNEAYQAVLYWFFSFPNMETGLNDLANDLGIAKTTAKRVVEDLEEQGFLIKKVYGRAWRITCAKDHPYNKTKKIAFNLSLIFDAYTNGLREHIFQVVENAQAIILFGSYRKGDDNKESDIDIAVEVVGNKPSKVVQLGVLPQFGYREGVPVNLHIFSRKHIDINLFSNIANGIVLEGFLEVKP